MLGAGRDDAELVRHFPGLTDARHCYSCAAGEVRLDHLLKVHPIDVVRTHHDDQIGLLITDKVQALEDGIRRAGKPAFSEPLLGRNRGDVGVEHPAQTPHLRHVTVERMGLVLSEHHYLTQA